MAFSVGLESVGRLIGRRPRRGNIFFIFHNPNAASLTLTLETTYFVAMSSLLTHPIAALLELPPYYIAIIVPLAGMILGGIIAIFAMYFKHEQRQLWHETARQALEKGQPIPLDDDNLPKPPRRPKAEQNDIRSGLILIAVGLGLAMFFAVVRAKEAMGIGAIPGFIGVALLLYGIFSGKKAGNNTLPPPNS